jgi:hypothetical protein
LPKKAAPAKTTAVWTLGADEDEMEDEDNLLQEDDLKLPARKQSKIVFKVYSTPT